MTDPTPPETMFTVDGDAERCPYCGQPFVTEHLRTLHIGAAHAEAMSETEAERYDDAHDEESDALFVFHIKVLGFITLIMFIFLYSYTFVWT